MDAICTLCPGSQKQAITEIEGWVSPPPPPEQPGHSPLPPLQVHTPPPAKVPVEASLGENTLQPLVRGQRPWIGQEEDVETIVSFSAVL